MTGEHRPERDGESQTALARRADLTRGEVGAAAVLGPSPPAEKPGAPNGRSLRRESAGPTT
jgi:hypothetical protein